MEKYPFCYWTLRPTVGEKNRHASPIDSLNKIQELQPCNSISNLPGMVKPSDPENQHLLDSSAHLHDNSPTCWSTNTAPFSYWMEAAGDSELPDGERLCTSVHKESIHIDILPLGWALHRFLRKRPLTSWSSAGILGLGTKLNKSMHGQMSSYNAVHQTLEHKDLWYRQGWRTQHISISK